MSPKHRHVVEFAAEWIAPICLIIIVPLLVVQYVSDHYAKVRTYKTQISACERGNLLRDRINTKFGVYDTAFEKAAETLKAATTPVGKDLYAVLHGAAVTAPDPIPLTNCHEVYERPRWFWQRTGGDGRPASTPGPTGPTGEGGQG